MYVQASYIFFQVAVIPSKHPTDLNTQCYYRVSTVVLPGRGSHSEAGVDGGVPAFLRPVYWATSARVRAIDDDDDTDIAKIHTSCSCAFTC